MIGPMGSRLPMPATISSASFMGQQAREYPSFLGLLRNCARCEGAGESERHDNQASLFHR
jgi:hypothetical protein